MFHKSAWLAAAVLVLVAASARAEIVKLAVFDCAKNEICLYIWPKLPAVAGWHTDEQANYENKINTLVPDGFTFDNTETVIYAEATDQRGYKTDHPDVTPLEGYIKDDMDTFRENNPDVEIVEADPLVTADGHKLRTFSFSKLKKDRCQIVAYGEEDNYYIIFVIDSRDEAGLARNLETYRALVKSYMPGGNAKPDEYTFIKRDK